MHGCQEICRAYALRNSTDISDRAGGAVAGDAGHALRQGFSALSYRRVVYRLARARAGLHLQPQGVPAAHDLARPDIDGGGDVRRGGRDGGGGSAGAALFSGYVFGPPVPVRAFGSAWAAMAASADGAAADQLLFLLGASLAAHV